MDNYTSAATEGARLSNWLADYSHDLKEEGDFDQEAAQIDKAAQWIADHLNSAAQGWRGREPLIQLLMRCRTVLGNMAEENEGAIFNRWPINHEPLRADAKGLVPLLDEALRQHHETAMDEIRADLRKGTEFAETPFTRCSAGNGDAIREQLREGNQLAKNVAERRQYYYRANGCEAADSRAPDCICWHDEGTGPYADGRDEPLTWRTISEPQGATTCAKCEARRKRQLEDGSKRPAQNNPDGYPDD